MPAKDGLRLNDLRRTKQARPEPGHPDQQGPVTAAQSKTRRCTPQGDAKLMAKEQVLRFKPARRLEEVDDEHCERMQEREHRPRSCDDSTRRCDPRPDEIFGKDNIAGITVHPDEPWMQQIARNVTMEGCGALRDCRYLLHDRDTKYTQSFRAIIASGQIEPLALPARSPNLNAYAERWVSR